MHTHTHTHRHTRRRAHAQASNNTVLGEIATQLGFDPLGCTVIIVECSARIDIRGKHVAGRLSPVPVPHAPRLHGTSRFLGSLRKLQRYISAADIII